MFENIITVIKCNKQINAEKNSWFETGLDDLTRAFKPGGIDGVTLLLSEKGKNGKPRVTNKTQILEKISQKIYSLSAN